MVSFVRKTIVGTDSKSVLPDAPQHLLPGRNLLIKRLALLEMLSNCTQPRRCTIGSRSVLPGGLSATGALPQFSLPGVLRMHFPHPRAATRPAIPRRSS